MKNLSIAKKLIAAFLVLVVAFAGVSALVFTNLTTISSTTDQNEESAELTLLANKIFILMLEQQNAARGFLTGGEEEFATAYVRHKAAFLEAVAEFQQKTTVPVQRERAAALAAAVTDWQTRQADRQIELYRDPVTRERAREMTGEIRLTKPREILAEIVGAELPLMDERRTALRDATSESELVLLIGGLAAMLVAGAMGFLLTRMIARPVQAMTEVMRRLAGGDKAVEVPAVGQRDEIGWMAQAVLTFREQAIEKDRVEAEALARRSETEEERRRNEEAQDRAAKEQALVVHEIGSGLSSLSGGDLTYRIETAFPGEYEKLRADFNAAIDQLQTAMRTITGATEGIRSGTGEISQASDDLSKRTEQQAASLEETAAALDQITATVKRTAEGSNHARDVVSKAKDGAEQSGEIVKTAVTAMHAIESSSKKISQIIGVIDEIAFQTNLLALNAGVEAARAGDAGKGFAVVASEVRALAQRSAEAAKEIKTLIQTSSSQVDQGVDLVGRAGEALSRIVEQVTEINEIVRDISASAQEQATGLGEVNTAVNQMDQVTQQNAAMVEETTAAAHNLSGEASELARLVSQFRLEKAGTRPAAAPAATPVSRKTRVARGGLAVVGNTALKAAPTEESWEEF